MLRSAEMRLGSMRETVLQLATTLRTGIASDEACASELAHIAAVLDGRIEGHLLVLLLMVSRHHTVKAMELRGRLAALMESYESLVPPD